VITGKLMDKFGRVLLSFFIFFGYFFVIVLSYDSFFYMKIIDWNQIKNETVLNNLTNLLNNTSPIVNEKIEGDLLIFLIIFFIFGYVDSRFIIFYYFYFF
jgi:hypothetical protein